MTRSSNAVFISYASEDAPAAQRICAALRSAGIEVWFDRNELRGGDAWDRQIKQQINECALFIAIISAHSDARDEGYFRREWRLAVERTHDLADDTPFLLPVAIDATAEAKARVPEPFRHVQWTHLTPDDVPPQFVARVQSLLHRERSQPAASRASPADVASPATAHGALGASSAIRPTPRRIPRTAVVIAAVAALVAGSVYYLKSARPSTHAPAAAADKSIAVLPFIDMSEKRDQEYFSDGLTEELIDHLAHAPELRVVSRTSSFQFKGRSEDIRTIAEKLGVANVLEGSVRKAGEELRVTAQLIRASDGTHLWSESYDRGLKDIFKLQDDIATTVSSALRVALNPMVTKQPLGEPGKANTEAYTSFLKANYYWARGNSGDNARAIEQYQVTIRQQPDYALAWAQLARVYIWQSVAGEVPAAEAAARARQAAERALAIDPNCATAHYALGNIHRFYDYDWKAATAEYEKAVSIDPLGPMSAGARGNIALTQTLRTGNSDDYVRILLADSGRDPLDTDTLANLAAAQQNAGQLEASAVTSRRLLAIDPRVAAAHSSYAGTLLLQGKTAEALAAAQQETDELSRLTMLACIYWTMGRHADSDAALATMEAGYAQRAAYAIAVAHAWRGETDAAFTWLERAYRQRDGNVPVLRADSMMRSLRGDPRFRALLDKMNLSS